MGEWRPGRWWRVTTAAGLWCETSVEQEALDALTTAPGPARLQRVWIREEVEWRDDDRE